MKIALHLRCQRPAEILRVARIDEVAVPAELREGLAELGERAAIELARRQELVARRHQREERQDLRRVAREVAATAARPPSRLAMRSSSTATVGLVRRE